MPCKSEQASNLRETQPKASGVAKFQILAVLCLFVCLFCLTEKKEAGGNFCRLQQESPWGQKVGGIPEILWERLGWLKHELRAVAIALSESL